MSEQFDGYEAKNLTTERPLEIFLKPEASQLEIGTHPAFVVKSENEKDKCGTKKNVKYSYNPYMSGTSLPPNAFQEELSGKSLPDQVKFLKEHGYTFRVISERLNVPMTNCYTAIKKFHLPKEYWDRIKTELRRKRRAQEAAEENAVAKVLAKIPPFSKKQRLLDGIQNNPPSSNGAEEENIVCLPSSEPPTRQEFPKAIQRKHLTHEDGKLVQYYRDQGLTLQKIAEKLQIPISSCYRILKRYQVSQKAGMIMGAKQKSEVHEPEFAATECSPSTKSTSELLLGMVDASMKSMPYSPTPKSPCQEVVAENPKTDVEVVKNEQNYAKSDLAVDGNKHYPDLFNGKDFDPTPENLLYFLAWGGKSKCLMCGVDIGSLNAASYIKHTKLHQAQLAKLDVTNERLNSINEDDDIAPTLQPQSTTGSSQPQSPSLPLQPEAFDLRNLPSTSAASIADISHVLQAIREKLEWASKEITTTTDPEKILGLMKVMASGLQILGQYANSTSKQN